MAVAPCFVSGVTSDQLQEKIRKENINCFLYEPPHAPKLLQTLDVNHRATMRALEIHGSQLVAGEELYFRLTRTLQHIYMIDCRSQKNNDGNNNMMRKDNRLAIENAWLQLQRIPADSSTPSRYQVYNISRGGLRFSSLDAFETQERINITLHLPNNTEHKSLGRICYCETDTENKMGSYYGVSFLENFLDMTPFQGP